MDFIGVSLKCISQYLSEIILMCRLVFLSGSSLINSLYGSFRVILELAIHEPWLREKLQRAGLPVVGESTVFSIGSCGCLNYEATTVGYEAIKG